MNAEGGEKGRLGGRGAGVDQVLAGRDEVDHRQLLLRREQCRIAANQLLRDSGYLIRRQGNIDACVLAGFAKSPDMVVHAIRLLVKIAKQIGDRGPEHDAEIVDRQPRFRSRHKTSAEVDDWLAGHDDSRSHARSNRAMRISRLFRSGRSCCHTTTIAPSRSCVTEGYDTCSPPVSTMILGWDHDHCRYRRAAGVVS